MADGGSRAADKVLVQTVDHGVEEDLGLWRTAAGVLRRRGRGKTACARAASSSAVLQTLTSV